MADLRFEIQVKWSGTGKHGEGQIVIGEQTFSYSAPANMGGKGIGVSPEDLLISAVTSCYSGTLYGILHKGGLPVQRIHVRAEGFVTGYSSQTKFNRLVVHPTVLGGDETKRLDYEKAAITARDNCFIGESISGNIDYEVGEVQVVEAFMQQEQIDELVERFYSLLMKDPYYPQMFAERKVDLAVLKERQKVFIARLVNARALKEDRDHGEVSQVQERHRFDINPERAETWLNKWKESMLEMRLERDIMEPLLEKIGFLVNKLTE